MTTTHTPEVTREQEREAIASVPTGLFSSHTAFPGWYMHDTTDILPDYLAAWRGIGVDIDAIASRFLLRSR